MVKNIVDKSIHYFKYLFIFAAYFLFIFAAYLKIEYVFESL